MKLYLELEAVNFQEFLLTHRRAAWGKSRMKLEDQVQIESEDGDSGEKKYILENGGLEYKKWREIRMKMRHDGNIFKSKYILKLYRSIICRNP